MSENERIARVETRIEGLIKDCDAHATRLDRMETDIGGVRRAMAWLMGAGAILGAIASQALSNIADKLK